jgi:hypothetical protein
MRAYKVPTRLLDASDNREAVSQLQELRRPAGGRYKEGTIRANESRDCSCSEERGYCHSLAHMSSSCWLRRCTMHWVLLRVCYSSGRCCCCRLCAVVVWLVVTLPSQSMVCCHRSCHISSDKPLISPAVQGNNMCVWFRTLSTDTTELVKTVWCHTSNKRDQKFRRNLCKVLFITKYYRSRAQNRITSQETPSKSAPA